MENGKTSRQLQLDISWRTIFKVLLAILLAFAVVKLRLVFEILVVAILFSIVLYRIVAWALRRRWPKWVGVLLASLTLLLVIGGLFGLIVPMVSREASKVPEGLPKLKEQVLAKLPQNGPLNGFVQTILNSGTGPDAQRTLTKGLGVAKATIGGIIDAVIVFALVIYLMIDGPRALQWWIAFFPPEKRPRVSKGLDEIGHRVVAYVTGQLIVSVLFATYTCILLSVLRVPMALLLGVLAGMVDILPILGILIAVVPAALIALTVSPGTALGVVAGYLCYHGLENYLIVPKVYGNKLKISTLAVLVSMLAGGVLAGVIGAITALILTAAYPALERLWFARRLEPEVLKDHADLRAA